MTCLTFRKYTPSLWFQILPPKTLAGSVNDWSHTLHQTYIGSQIAEVESEIVQAETTTITEKEAETTEAKVEKEKTEATTEVEKEKIETEGKEKKKRKRKTELQSLIDTANNVNF